MLSKRKEAYSYPREEQWIVDATDVHGLKKALAAAINQHGDAGLYDTPYYVGALLTLETLFNDESVDYWTDFIRDFEITLNELEGEADAQD